MDLQEQTPRFLQEFLDGTDVMVGQLEVLDWPGCS